MNERAPLTPTFPETPAIPPGLGRLPRQIGMFPDFRASMARRLARDPRLAHWRARDEDDLGLMLIDSWAYICDVIAFYTAELAQDLYLRSARDEQSLREIVGLIGHEPRPALAAEAVLAAIVEADAPVIAPAGAGFVSDSVDDAPPQDFELSSATTLDPLRNAWPLAPIRDEPFDGGDLLIDPATRNLAEGMLFVMASSGEAPAALRAETVTPETALDGATYLRVTTKALPTFAQAPSADVSLWAFTQTAPLIGGGGAILLLPGLYQQLRVGEMVLVEDMADEPSGPPEVHRIGGLRFEMTDLAAPPAAPPKRAIGSSDRLAVAGSASAIGSREAAIGALNFSREDMAPTAPALAAPVTVVSLERTCALEPSRARLHFGRVSAGRPTSPAKTRIGAEDVRGPTAIAGRHETPDTPAASEVLLKGAGARGERMRAAMAFDGRGRATLRPDAAPRAFAAPLRAPVVVHGNLLRITRGKTTRETLGDGDGSAFQQFELAKSPLTHVRDPAAPGGRRSTLRLFCDGVEWREIGNLFRAGPNDRVYTLDLDARGAATVTFGDGLNGQTAPLGVANIRAIYRHGAGDPSPGAGAIRQIAGPVEGLRRVFNVTPAFGGGPGDDADAIRDNAPASAATFDRAVSAADFAALARDFGALAAVAACGWRADRQRVGVSVIAVFEGEPTAEAVDQLEAHLRARAAEGLPIAARAARAREGALVLGFVPDPTMDAAATRRRLRARLLDPATGLLAPRRAAIGGPVFRSTLLAAAAAVEGVGAIADLSLDGAPAPVRIALAPDQYFAPSLSLEERAP